MGLAYDTALNLVADSAAELALVPAGSVTDAFGSTDPNILLLCQLMKSVGRDLMRAHQWSNLQNFWLFQTVDDVGRYALPNDYDRAIDQTFWNRSNRLPLGGPLSPQEFQFMSARLVGISWNILFRTLQGKFQAYPSDITPGGYAISYEYMSNFWVVPAGTEQPDGPWQPNCPYTLDHYIQCGGNIYQCGQTGTSGTTAALSGTGHISHDGTCTWDYISAAGTTAPTANTDTILLDPELFRAALKLKFLQGRGFDYAAAQGEYDAALAKAKDADTVAPILYWNRPTYAEPLLGPWNLPVNGTAGQ